MFRRVFIMIALCLVFLSGCSSDFLDILKEQTDRIVISLYNDQNSRIEISGKSAVTETVGFVSEKQAPAYKCGYHGSMTFYSENTPLLEEDAEFNISPECRHIVFLYNNTLFFRELTEDGVRYLQNLYEAESGNRPSYAYPAYYIWQDGAFTLLHDTRDLEKVEIPAQK